MEKKEQMKELTKEKERVRMDVRLVRGKKYRQKRKESRKSVITRFHTF